MKILDRHVNTFTHLCQPSPTLFLDDVTSKILSMMKSGAAAEEVASIVQQHISTFEHVRGNVIPLENELLTLVGCGKEIVSVKRILRQLNHAVACLEELYCMCFEGHEGLNGEHGKRTLLYQRDMNHI